MGQRKAKQDASAMALFNMARQYHDAANELSLIATTKRRELRDPLYLLYFHTIELTLKAFLRTHNKPLLGKSHRTRHNLTMLYNESRDLGLKIGPQDKIHMVNIVSGLDSANAYQGLRYFNMEFVLTVDLAQVNEFTAELMQAVEPHVLARPVQKDLKSGIKVIVTMSKLEPIPKIGV
jgi:hypothetical protein